MQLRPVWLLLPYFLLPVGFGFWRVAIAQILLTQIRAAYMARQGEQRLNPDDDTDESFEEFIRAFWQNQTNTTAQSYLSFLFPRPVLLSHHDGDRIPGNEFTLVGQANPNTQIVCRVTARSVGLGGLIPLSEPEELLSTQVMTDDDGRFEIPVSVQTRRLAQTRYTVFVVPPSEQDPMVSTQMTLTHR